MAVPFWGSVILHVLVLGGLSAGAFLENRFHLNMGSPTGGGLGGVMVNPVASIPLPNRGGPENPVANDTQSQVPTPPAPKEKANPLPKEKAPSAKAIALKNDKALKRLPGRARSPTSFATPSNTDQPALQQHRPTGEFSDLRHAGRRWCQDRRQFALREQFGAYANIIRETIARNWNPTSFAKSAGSPSVVR